MVMAACVMLQPAMIQPAAVSSVPLQPRRRCGAPMQRRRHSHTAPSAPEVAVPADLAASAGAGPPKCRTCGIEMSKAPRKCDQEGHVLKGLSSLPGFGWFTLLRVYGPCPELAKNGLAYTRKGQNLDEILFGGAKRK